ALDAVAAAGFSRKTGSTHLQWGTTPRWDLWFADSDTYEESWFVERARFDAILFQCAVDAGVEARTRCSVKALHFDDDALRSVTWQDERGAMRETTRTG
ncbi:MAG: hypothetical protein AAF721_38545, partial [Myxococcota bacterium]